MAGVDRLVADRPHHPHDAGGERQLLGPDLPPQRDALGGARQPEGDVNDIVARRQAQDRLRGGRFGDQRPRARTFRLGGENTPSQTAVERLVGTAERSRQAQGRLVGIERAAPARAPPQSRPTPPSPPQGQAATTSPCRPHASASGGRQRRASDERARRATMRRIEGRFTARRIPAMERGLSPPPTAERHERNDRSPAEAPLGPAPDDGRTRARRRGTRNAAEDRLARARPRQADALAVHRLFRRGARARFCGSRSTSASSTRPPSTRRRASSNSSASSARRLSSRSSRAQRRMSKSPNGSRFFQPVPAA